MSGMYGRRRPKSKMSRSEAQEAAIYVGVRAMCATVLVLIVALVILATLQRFHIL